MIRHHVIGLCGLAGSGKDTAADILVTHCGFRKLAFADALRGEVTNAFSVEPVIFTARHTKDTPHQVLALDRGPIGFAGAVIVSLQEAGASIEDMRAFMAAPRSPRQIIQWWGTEYRRRQNVNYWVAQVAKKVAYHHREGERRFVITDCRYDNEAAYIREQDGAIWQMQRSGITASTTPEGTHSSATDGTQFGPDAVFSNPFGGRVDSHEPGAQGAELKALRSMVLCAWWQLEAGLDWLHVEIADRPAHLAAPATGSNAAAQATA